MFAAMHLLKFVWIRVHIYRIGLAFLARLLATPIMEVVPAETEETEKTEETEETEETDETEETNALQKGYKLLTKKERPWLYLTVLLLDKPP